MSPWDMVSRAKAALSARSIAPFVEIITVLSKTEIEPVSEGWEIIENTSMAARKRKSKHVENATETTCTTRDFEYVNFHLENLSDEFEQVQFERFSLSQPPKLWHRTMLLNQPLDTMDARIDESVKDICKEQGVEGILQVILWATAYKFQSGESVFWRKVEDSAGRCLIARNYLVLVEGYLGELQRSLGGKPCFHDGTHFIVDGECFFQFQAGRGLELLSYAEGLSMLGVDDLSK